MPLFIILLSIITLLFEATITQLPLTLILLLLLFVLTKKPWVFVVAFVLGILLDLLSVRPIGLSSLFFLTFLFLISLYDRKYEIKTPIFILLASILGSTLFLFIFQTINLMLIVISTTIAILSFYTLTSFF